MRALPGSPHPVGCWLEGALVPVRATCSSTWRIALSEGFVVSKIVISKETPLYDPIRVYRSAIEQAKVPGRPGSAIDEIATGLQEALQLCRAVPVGDQDDSPVDGRFAATLFLHDYGHGEEEFTDRIVRFWAGDPLPVADLRRRLKEAGASATYRLGTVKERRSFRQRFRFVSRLAQAAGYCRVGRPPRRSRADRPL